MTSAWKGSAGHVQDFLAKKGFSFEVKEFPGSTRTAQEAADRVGCQVSQIAKSLVFKEKQTGEPILIIAAGTPFAVFQMNTADLAPLTGGRWVDLSG